MDQETEFYPKIFLWFETSSKFLVGHGLRYVKISVSKGKAYRLFLFNATTLEKHVVYQLHKVGKFDEILTKIDRRSGKEIEETKFLKNGDAVMIIAIGVIKSVEKKDPSGAKVTKFAAKKK
ncbi:hypothetical protein ACFX2G_023285 [Malus domestica]